jgi:hypothetical protein
LSNVITISSYGWLGANQKLFGTTGAPDAEPWRQAIEAEALDVVPKLAIHRTSEELRIADARRRDFVLNLEDNVERDRRARTHGRGSERLGEIAS